MNRAPLIIAEAGVNHNGDIGRAIAMVDAAVHAGADIIKFQAFNAKSLVTEHAKTAAYQASNTGRVNQSELLKELELSKDAFIKIAEHCAASKIEFLCTPFDVEMTADLVELGMKRIKVASGELTNLPALQVFAEFGLPILLSTGMATLDEVREALNAMRVAEDKITCLHCTSLYPAPFSTLNLKAMVTMQTTFRTPVGYSDHSLGDHAAIAAVALGACVIEKHFTLDRSLPGPDHSASMEPAELGRMIIRLREVSTSLGDGDKKPSLEEANTAALVRRSWHSTRALPKGHTIVWGDVTLKRPADGLPPGQTPLGKKLKRRLGADEPVRLADFS